MYDRLIFNTIHSACSLAPLKLPFFIQQFFIHFVLLSAYISKSEWRMTSVRKLNKNEVPVAVVTNKCHCISLILWIFVSYKSNFIVSPNSCIVVFSPEETNTLKKLIHKLCVVKHLIYQWKNVFWGKECSFNRAQHHYTWSEKRKWRTSSKCILLIQSETSYTW